MWKTELKDPMSLDICFVQFSQLENSQRIQRKNPRMVENQLAGAAALDGTTSRSTCSGEGEEVMGEISDALEAIRNLMSLRQGS
jgi:hypothetical protein